MTDSPQRDLFLLEQQAAKAKKLLGIQRDLTRGEREDMSDMINFMLATLRGVID
jgi:hypothetical protein|tara:strand:- start:934 stop:1095 length:162 start_codon:yes stop_codon:yes gene_type:complete